MHYTIGFIREQVDEVVATIYQRHPGLVIMVRSRGRTQAFDFFRGAHPVLCHFDPQDGGARFHSSAPLLGAVFLGMTGAALWRAGADRQMGTYFEAGEADLDQRGAAVIAALRAAHGRPVAIMTLLDT